MGQFSITHLLLLAILLLLFFGPSRLPQLGQSLGKAIRGFKDGLSGQDPESQQAQRPVGSNTPDQLTKGQSGTTSQNQTQTEKDPHRQG